MKLDHYIILMNYLTKAELRARELEEWQFLSRWVKTRRGSRVIKEQIKKLSRKGDCSVPPHISRLDCGEAKTQSETQRNK